MRISTVLFFGSFSLGCSTVLAAPSARTVLVKATPLPPEKLRGQIAYVQDSDLWVVNPKTRKSTLLFQQLFNEKGALQRDEQVTWTPDLRFLIFTYNRGPWETYTGNELMIMRWDGQQKRQLTDTGLLLCSEAPQVSPDGTRILYSRTTGYRSGGPGYTGREIRVMNFDGSNDHRVVGNIEDLDSAATNPYWNRDGQKIVFSRYDGDLDYTVPKLYTSTLDGENQQVFSGSWSQFVVPWVSSNGLYEVQQPIRSHLSSVLKFHSKQPKNYVSFDMSSFTDFTSVVSPTSAQVAFSASRMVARKTKGNSFVFRTLYEMWSWSPLVSPQTLQLMVDNKTNHRVRILRWL